MDGKDDCDHQEFAGELSSTTETVSVWGGQGRAFTRRIYVSMVSDQALSESQIKLKWAVVERIQSHGFQPEVFYNPKTVDGLAARKIWTPSEVERVVRHCVGGVIIGMPRWTLSDGKQTVQMTNEYAQYEGALMNTLDIPILILAEQNMLQRGVFENSFGRFICRFPSDADASWLNSATFQQALSIWLADIKDRRDIFLGYCSSSRSTAEAVRSFLEKDLRVTVLDWKRDFSVARTVLDEISEAGRTCSGGIFLFTRDDHISDESPDTRRRLFRRNAQRPDFAIPRDNVVFEAGYFIGIKGKRRVLIVREQGAKMPADLGGDVYASLEDRHDIEPIKETIRRFALAL